MKHIPIYKREVEDGIAEIIQSKSSLIYCSQLLPNDSPPLTDQLDSKILTRATNEGQIDLFYTKDILVSTGWNLNDEFFTKEDIWSARATSEDKPFNLGHNSHEIIGHITNNVAIGVDGTTIADNSTIDELPAKFHILNQSVIYMYWPDKEYMKKIHEIIAQIKQNKWCVSMEAIFSDYDFAIATEDSIQIVKRDSKSAFLSAHLRAYGGTGIYNNQKVGRVPRDFVFSGKGLVETPANPDSIILSSNNLKNEEDKSKVVYVVGYIDNMIKSEEKEEIMSEQEIKALQDAMAALKTEVETEKTARLKVESDFITAKSKLEGDLAIANAQVADVAKKADTFLAEKTSLEALVAELQASLKLSTDELSVIKAEKIKAERVGVLVAEFKLSNEDATSLYETVASLDADKFAAYVSQSKKLYENKVVTPVNLDKVLENVEVKKEISLNSAVDPTAGVKKVRDGLIKLMSGE